VLKYIYNDLSLHRGYYIVIYSCIYFSATTLYVLLSLLCLKHICNIFIINYDGLIFSLFLFVFKADIDYIYSSIQENDFPFVQYCSHLQSPYMAF
jgi:hypothetical protein